VRIEYAFVPDAGFRVGRARVLHAFLARPAIYATPPVHAELEARARANLARSLAQLES
jgi:predicted metal-dependent HD superfamily phosphohydrolase